MLVLATESCVGKRLILTPRTALALLTNPNLLARVLLLPVIILLHTHKDEAGISPVTGLPRSREYPVMASS